MKPEGLIHAPTRERPSEWVGELAERELERRRQVRKWAEVPRLIMVVDVRPERFAAG